MAPPGIEVACGEIASGNQDLSVRTEQFTSTVRQSAAVAQSLKEQAQRLVSAVEVFRA